MKIVQDESGREIPEEAFEKKKAERDLLMAQSIHRAGRNRDESQRGISAQAERTTAEDL